MQIISSHLIKDAIRNIPDFPIKGIQFKDITTVLKQPQLFNQITDEMANFYSDRGITKIVAVESRGFIIGGALAYRLNAGLVPVRKPGKLPSLTHKVTYDLEYGKDTLEMHQDALKPDDIVLIHDDLLATGGTALATINLVKLFNVKKIFVSFIIELDFLNGRERLAPFEVFSLVHFNE
jgi:adenine phosphoribosyltransferase